MSKAKINNAVWRQYPAICLGISVGKPAFEGASMLAILDCAERTGKPVIIRVSDTLQRHNIAAQGIDMPTATKLSADAGDAWLDQFGKHALAIPNIQKIIRWNELLYHPQFETTHTQLVRAETVNPIFRDALRQDIDRFAVKQGDDIVQATLRAAHSRAFLLEEAAGFILFGKQHASVRLYPGRETESLRVIRLGLVPEAPKGLENTGFAGLSIRGDRPNIANDLKT